MLQGKERATHQVLTTRDQCMHPASFRSYLPRRIQGLLDVGLVENTGI